MADANSQHWSQLKEGGSLFGMRLLLCVQRWGGPLLFRIFLFPVICYYVLFRRQSYRASYLYLSRMHAFDPALPAPGFTRVFAHFWNFGLALIDKLDVWSGRITLADVVLHNAELMEGLLDSRKGALLLISHLGNFEVCQALSETLPQLKLTVLHHTVHAANFNTVLNQHKAGSTITLRQVTDIDMGLAMRLGEKVGAGEFVALAGDRVAIDNPDSAITVDFLGHPAPLPSGPFVLGLALQGPIVTVFCIKEAGRYHVYFDTLWQGGAVKRAERQAFIQALVQQYAQRLEYYCRKAPLQWYNFYSFWH